MGKKARLLPRVSQTSRDAQHAPWKRFLKIVWHLFKKHRIGLTLMLDRRKKRSPTLIRQGINKCSARSRAEQGAFQCWGVDCKQVHFRRKTNKLQKEPVIIQINPVSSGEMADRYLKMGCKVMRRVRMERCSVCRAHSCLCCLSHLHAVLLIT